MSFFWILPDGGYHIAKGFSVLTICGHMQQALSCIVHNF